MKVEITEPSKADSPQNTAGNTPQSQPHPVQLLQSTVKPATHNWGLWIGLVLLAALIVGWLVGILLAEPLRFAIRVPIAEAGIESTAMLSECFGALVLFLFPTESLGRQLHWVGGGFLVLGIGSLSFGYLHPIVLGKTDLNASIYAWILAQLVAGIFFVAGLTPFGTPRFSKRLVAATAIVFLALGTVVEYIPDRLSTLVDLDSLRFPVQLGKTPVPWLSGWHWLLSALPFVLALIALLGVIYHRRHGQIGGWLVLAMVMLAGSELYNIFWPSAYSLTLTAADILRLGFAGVVIIGGVLELRLQCWGSKDRFFIGAHSREGAIVSAIYWINVVHTSNPRITVAYAGAASWVFSSTWEKSEVHWVGSGWIRATLNGWVNLWWGQSCWILSPTDTVDIW